MCFAAKWLDDDEMFFWSDHNYGHEVMVKKAHLLLDDADVVVTWNGKRFDIPHLNREFLEMGLKPPSPVKQIDLCQVVKQKFRFPSNKLQYVSTTLGFRGKDQHEGHALWTKCMDGDPVAWGQMEAYNRQDVQLLEDLYYKLQPWITNHPSHAALSGEVQCPNCESFDLQKRGFAITAQSRFQRYQCQNCGHWTRSTKAISQVSIRSEV